MSNPKYLEKEDFIQKAEAIYKKIRPKLEKKHRAEVIAIEPESKKYVIGKDELEATLKARKHFPGKIYYFIRIGFPVMHKFRKIGNW